MLKKLLQIGRHWHVTRPSLRLWQLDVHLIDIDEFASQRENFTGTHRAVKCNDDKGVDFGLWKTIKPTQLLIPLDVHVERQARRLGLLKRPKVDWQAVLELTESLRQFDKNDPVKYDFALFGLGIEEKSLFLP